MGCTMTAFLSREDLQSIALNPSSLDEASGDVGVKLRELHEQIHAQFRMHNLHLRVFSEGRAIVHPRSVATLTQGGGLAINYLRGLSEAEIVERLMGREEVGNGASVEARRHPVIEIRLTPEHFTVELLLSPDAWWDQQNMVGKLSIERHRDAIYKLLRNFPGDYRLGFWRGVHLSDMHIRGEMFRHRRVLDEWLSTFEPGKDWFRVGTWYELDDELLAPNQIRDEVIQQIKLLYPLYQDILWTGDNNFRTFYSAQR